MGLRSRLASWLQPSATPAEPIAARSEAACSGCADLRARVEQLELQRPAFIAELENLLESCTEILDRAESKRARIAANESKRKKREEAPELAYDPTDREQVKAMLRSRAPAWRRGEPVQ